MKYIIVILGLIALATGARIPDGATGMGVIASLVSEPDCSPYAYFACTREYEPVCGTNGVEYSNECMLCLHIADSKELIFIRRRGNC